MSAAALVIVLLSLALLGGLAWMLALVVRDTRRKRGNWGINAKPPNHCPRCHAALPAVRVPKNLRQMMWGGWTCAGCTGEIDKWGNLIA